ncbi:MAG: type V CRISPR-associated protein Cas4 [Bacteroidetes bacterium HGW-Bacteroidetes-6]|nr:MAG: type V CRISPR-associated protein Cas4 [Bacteroidetes bacterium HGW-Bacteroidetes-6]
MDDYILISTLNDFIFCPYSIYLHNVYAGGDEGLYQATPQAKGKAAHKPIDEKNYSSRKDEITGLPVFSDEFGLSGKIDLYKSNEKLLIERKYKLDTIYRGQIYQLWAQYFCMIEMGYAVDKLAFYVISTNTMHPIEVPSENDKKELLQFINDFRNYNPENEIHINPNKCTHCIYCNLCDKINTENVYT